MSREGRAAHARNKRRHDQRQFGEVKPALQSVAQSTLWVGPFLESVQGVEYLTVTSPQVLPLGTDGRTRMLKLRDLSHFGVLRMYAHREDGQFVEYRWELSEAGKL